MMISSPDDAKQRFDRILKENQTDLSEADTKSKIIDRIFKECLNWAETDIKREGHSQSGFADYVFKIDDRPLFVLEAKREGINFEIPPNFTGRRYKISGVISECKELISAIDQAQRYCIDRGVRVGIVTNGYQYVIFETFKFGSPWREGKCIIYHSFQDISTNFGSFWTILNKNSVENGSLIKALSETPEIKQFERPLDMVHNKEEKLTRNYLHEYISPFVDYIFGEMTDPSKFDILNKCYVYEKAYGSADSEIKNYFIDRLPYYAKGHNIKDFFEEDKDAGIFKVNFEKCVKLVKSQAAKGSMILLLGGVGSGKTTFIHRFFNIILKNKSIFFWFYIDLRKSPIEESKIEGFIIQKIMDQFENEYIKEVREKLEKISNRFSITLDKSNEMKYVSSLFAILRCLGYSIALVVDNVDQHKADLQ